MATASDRSDLEAVGIAWAASLEGEQGDIDRAWEALSRSVSTEALTAVARTGLAVLNGPDGDLVLTLLDLLDDPDLFDELAVAVEADDGLPADRLWRALEVLEGTGRIEASPSLSELRDDLRELVCGAEATVGALVEQLEDSPEDVWFALQGLGAIESDVRAEIVGELGDYPLNAGLVELLRLLAYSDDEATRRAALDSLRVEQVVERVERVRVSAWRDLSSHHPDPSVAALSRSVAGLDALEPRTPRATALPELRTAVVGGLDGRGIGRVGLMARRPSDGRWAAALFTCDVERGVVAIAGEVGSTASSVEALVDALRADPAADVVEPAIELAVGLLARCWAIGRPADPSARYWIEATLGSSPGSAPLIDRPDHASTFSSDGTRQAASILDACPDWVDRSERTYALAEELLLRHGVVEPDPSRDASAFRFLFEHRLSGRLEFYRRMLTWMGCFWRVGAANGLAGAALDLAAQLGDPQHSVPSHPFVVELARRSLAAAMRDLADGRIIRARPDGR